ncbi:MAG: hypothetical protein HYS33_04360 [Acidobacteria bacterium]|nr:hypothetical protein [Acidobacteriota bacterium]MBI1983071.1 hypothetical protein [Acidobacteriota bacterium]
MEKRAVEEAEEKAEVNTRSDTMRWVRVCVAAWLIPGCGHLLLGRKGRALILFASILSMFLLGLAMQGQFFSIERGAILRTLGFFGEMCVGVAMPVATFLGYSGGNGFSPSSDYGTAFLVAAGMLNALTVFDAYDIALGRKD